MRGKARQRAHRATTRHLGAAYPWMAGSGLGHEGAYIGDDRYGGGAWVYDPWVLYGRRVITSPNMLVLGQLGAGKSSLVKSYIFRQATFGRRTVYLDPKGETRRLCEALGTEPVKLSPGGRVRLNPLDQRIAGRSRLPAQALAEQLTVLYAVIEAALGRDLTEEERAACGEALAHVNRETSNRPTLPQVAEALLLPTDESAEHLLTTREQLAERSRDAALALRRICLGELAGMFDGETTDGIDLEAPFVALDMSSVWESPALGILMVCAGAWLQGAVIADAEAGAQRILVLDEAWALLRNLAVARWLQASWKLARAAGVQNIAIVHRLSDLTAAGASDSEQVKLAAGLLRDSETQVIYRQSTAEIAQARELLDLSDSEAALIPQLIPGAALWRVGRRRALVDHRLSIAEERIVDTDARMLPC